MSIFDMLKQRITGTEKKASFQSSKFSSEFVTSFIKTAESFDCTAEEAIEHLKVLENASERTRK